MKVIDLLNKIANEEELPKRVSINDYVAYDEYTIWTLEDGCYCRTFNDNKQFLFEYLTTQMLQDEVDIIEGTPKEDNKIEKIGLPIPHLSPQLLFLATKINEIIDRLNGEDNE